MIGDLRPRYIALLLSQQHDILTPQTLTLLGGEVHELQKQSYANTRLTESDRSLDIRVKLIRELNHSEKVWKDRLMGLLTAGLVLETLGKHDVLQKTKKYVDNIDTNQ